MPNSRRVVVLAACLCACAGDPAVRFEVESEGAPISSELRLGNSLETVLVGTVSTGAFSEIERPMWLGRPFIEADHTSAARPAMILSHPLWTRLGGDPAVVGSEATLDGEVRIILGVLSPGAELRPDMDVLIPRLRSAPVGRPSAKASATSTAWAGRP